MNTNLGYSKRTLTNTDVLLSGGGNKPLSEFIGSISWDATNRKIKYTPVGGSATDLVTLSSLAITNYSLPKAKTNALGGIIVSNVLTTAVTLTSGNGTTANRYYGVQLDKDGKAFVNVPWSYSVFTGATSSAAGTTGLVKQPAAGDQGKFLRGDCTWLSISLNVSSALYVGGSGDLTANAAQSTNGNVYLTLKEGTTYYKHNIVGSGRASVTSDANGKITINSSGYSNFTAATSSAAGSAGLVPAPGANVLGSGGYFLRADGTWAVPINTWIAWKGATDSANGTAGYMPAPTSAQRTQFLRGDGSWVSLNNFSLPARLAETITANTAGSTYNGFGRVASSGPFSGITGSSTDCMTINTAYSSAWAGELATDYRTSNIAYRAKNNGTWTAWAIMLSNKNSSVSKSGETLTVNLLGSSLSITNTWRGIYTGGTSRVGTGTNTLPINFAAGSNVTITYEAAGTGSGLSGSASYFNVKIAATNTWNANAVGVAGYVAAPTKAANANMTWQTDSDGVPAWRASNNHTHSYLPLSGGTISHNDFAPFFIQRNHTTNAAGIGFKHYSSGTTVEVMGYIGMSEKDGALKRWNGAISTVYTILDSSNSSVSLSGSTLTVKINGTSKSLTNTWTAMTGATSSANGTVGYVNAAPPKDGYNTKFLRADGTWSVPDGTFWGNSWSNGGSISGAMTFSSLAMATSYTDVWSDGTNIHPWYGYDHRYPNTGVYSTTITDYFGITIKTASGNISMNDGGNVGIGTTSPSTKLHISGGKILINPPVEGWTTVLDGYCSSLGAGQAIAITIGKTNSQYNACSFQYHHVGDGSSSNYIALSMYDANRLLTVNAAGNVGIGTETTAPSYKLHVNGITGSTNFISSVATGTQPYACSSTTLNTNLNADLLDGYHGHQLSHFGDINNYNNALGSQIIPVASSDPFGGNSNYFGSIFQWSNTFVNSPSEAGDQSSWYNQIMGLTNDQLYFRTRTNAGNWTSWKTLIHSGNISSYVNTNLPTPSRIFNTSGTTPYDFIYLCRIGNKHAYSGLNLMLRYTSRYDNMLWLSIRIATSTPAYGTSEIDTYYIGNSSNTKFYYVKTSNSSNWDYYDIYAYCGPWNTGNWDISKVGNSGNDGNFYVEYKEQLVDSLPSGHVQISSERQSSSGGEDSKYTLTYNSNDYGCSSSVTVNEMITNCDSNSTVGMFSPAVDNPTGGTNWVHVWSQQWSRKNTTAWVSQIAVCPQLGTGMWYRTSGSSIVGEPWTRVIDTNNVSSYCITNPMNESLHIYSTIGNWAEGIRMHVASNNWCGLIMCGSDNTGNTGTSAKTWSIHNNDGTFYIAKNGSDTGDTVLSCSTDKVWKIDGNPIITSSGGTLTGRLHINTDIDVESGSVTGSLLIGSTNAENIGIDANEIMARYGTTPSTLYLQANGGQLYSGADYNEFTGQIYRTTTSGDCALKLGAIEIGWTNEINVNNNIGGNLFLNYRYSGDIILGHGGGDVGIGYDNPNGERLCINKSIKLAGTTFGSAGFNSNPRIVFAEINNGTEIQKVGLVYTDWDAYRNGKGLKVTDIDGDDPTVWFEVGGNCYASNFYTTSDINKKKNIFSFSEHIRKFTLKETNKDAYGVIAQEVPEMFRDGKEGDMTVNYNSILCYYIGILENKIKDLENRIKQLENHG